MLAWIGLLMGLGTVSCRAQSDRSQPGVVPHELAQSDLAQSGLAQTGWVAGSPAANPVASGMGGIVSPQPVSIYKRPSPASRARNYAFDAFGPYPLTASAFTAGINQLTDSPPAWHQGVEGYARRFGSDFGIGVVGTTSRYALSEALGEDTLYYRCECVGFFPRLSHAVLSTLTARRGEDGHTVFSVPSLVAPYAGTMTAVYGWYPNRYGAKDAFRMGNYSLLAYMGGNISIEFLYRGPHSYLNRLHMRNHHAAPDAGSTP